MMTGRPGRRPLEFLPDEARSLPPPKLTDPRLAYFGFLGYCSGLLDNAIRQRPVLTAGSVTCSSGHQPFGPRGPPWSADHRLATADIQGLHRQLLYVTSFFFVGYYLLRRQDYMYAVKDHDMFSYIKSHPEDFPEKDKKTYGEKFEEFHPVR